jgi:hypothetical protein
MDDQAHKPHRKSKEKKKQQSTGGKPIATAMLI